MRETRSLSDGMRLLRSLRLCSIANKGRRERDPALSLVIIAFAIFQSVVLYAVKNSSNLCTRGLCSAILWRPLNAL